MARFIFSFVESHCFPAAGWSRWLLALTAAICILGSAAVGVKAQGSYLTDLGVPPFTAATPVENGFVNLANGNLHLEIPVGSFAQRGSKNITASFIYDSRIWRPVNSNPQYWYPDNTSGPGSLPASLQALSAGWRFITNAHFGSMNIDSNSIVCYGPEFPNPLSYIYYVYNNFSWEAPDGTVMSFPGGETVRNPPDNHCGSADSPTPIVGPIRADGSSGYVLYVTNYTDARVVAPDGTQVYPRNQDSNGNYISYVPATAPDFNDYPIDTLNRGLVTYVPNGPDCDTTFCYRILNSQGSTSKFKVTTQLIDVNTFFQQYNTNEFSGKITVMQRIDLPDGTNYQFTYDSGTLPGHYGSLTSMTLPAGGVVNFG